MLCRGAFANIVQIQGFPMKLFRDTSEHGQGSLKHLQRYSRSLPIHIISVELTNSALLGFSAEDVAITIALDDSFGRQCETMPVNILLAFQITHSRTLYTCIPARATNDFTIPGIHQNIRPNLGSSHSRCLLCAASLHPRAFATTRAVPGS